MNLLTFNDNQVIILIYFGLINVVTLILFMIDKIKAEKKQWRISENALLVISLIGGGTGALIGMVTFKHKLSKKKFTIGIPLLIILNRIVELLLFSILN